MVDMMITNVFYTKVIDEKDEEDRAPFAATKARGGGGVVATLYVEAFLENLVSEHSSLS